jgi:hypothetical protein
MPNAIRVKDINNNHPTQLMKVFQQREEERRKKSMAIYILKLNSIHIFFNSFVRFAVCTRKFIFLNAAHPIK